MLKAIKQVLYKWPEYHTLQTCHGSVIQGYLFQKPALLQLLWDMCLFVVDTGCIISMLY